jgi:hypothetical protein
MMTLFTTMPRGPTWVGVSLIKLRVDAFLRVYCRCPRVVIDSPTSCGVFSFFCSRAEGNELVGARVFDLCGLSDGHIRRPVPRGHVIYDTAFSTPHLLKYDCTFLERPRFLSITVLFAFLSRVLIQNAHSGSSCRFDTAFYPCLAEATRSFAQSGAGATKNNTKYQTTRTLM